MKWKLTVLPVLVVTACVGSAAFGALYFFIIDTCDPFFFRMEVFPRSGLPVNLWNRPGSLVLGFQSTWWMGAVLGLPLSMLALLLPEWRSYLQHSLISFGVLMGTVALIGFGAGFIHDAIYRQNGHTYQVFRDFGLLGAGVGLLLAAGYLVRAKLRGDRTQLRKTSET